MNHKVFISHSSEDKDIANAVCHYLEEDNIPCWIAPRDIITSDWADSIMKGIHSCDVFVVILSHNSIPSPEVVKEVTEATRVCQYILPFKIDEEMLDDRMRYHLGPIHWLDAVTPPMEKHICELRDKIHSLTSQDNVYNNFNRQRIIGKTVMPKNYFVGRDYEITRIREMLSDNHVLFLQGMGGIGKSEIAKGYAAAFSSEYDTVLFVNYHSSIIDTVIGDDIEIENIKRNNSYGEDAESALEFFKRKLRSFKALATNRTLLIVDNFDVKQDDHLEDLINGPYHILFTTRFSHKDYPALSVGPIQDFNILRQLFQRNYGASFSGEEQEVVDEIIRFVNCHTITIELIAKQMEASFLEPEEMLSLLKESGTNSGLEEEVESGGREKSAFDFIKDLFRLSTLNEEEQYLMKNMCMVPHSGIHVRRLKKYLDLKNLNTLNQLVSKSWLMLDNETKFVQMHPIICDVVKAELNPGQHNCQQYIMGLWQDISGCWFQTLKERSEKWPYVDHILRYYGDPTKELYQQYADFANTAWICAQFDQSIQASIKVYNFTLKEFGDAGFKPAFAARTVAGAYFNAGDEKNAEPYYYLGLFHILKRPEDSYKELGYLYEKAGRCAYLNGNFEKSHELLTLSLEAHEKARGIPSENTTPISCGDTYVQFERLYMAIGDYEKALEYCQQSYDLFYSWKNCEITSSAYTLSDMGICHSKLGNFEKANEYLNRALQLNIQFNGEASMVTVRTKESIADNFARQGNMDEAKKMYLLLELEMEKNFGSECPQVKRLREKGESL